MKAELEKKQQTFRHFFFVVNWQEFTVRQPFGANSVVKMAVKY